MGIATVVGVLAAKLLRDIVRTQPLGAWLGELPWIIPGSALAVIVPVTAACAIAARWPWLTATWPRCCAAALLLATAWTTLQLLIDPPHSVQYIITAQADGFAPHVSHSPVIGPSYVSYVDGFAAVLLAIIVPGRRRPRSR